MTTADPSQPTWINAQVGDTRRVIKMDDFLTVHEMLADEFRAAGLVGLALDQAIVDRLPAALAQFIDGVVIH